MAHWLLSQENCGQDPIKIFTCVACWFPQFLVIATNRNYHTCNIVCISGFLIVLHPWYIWRWTKNNWHYSSSLVKNNKQICRAIKKQLNNKLVHFVGFLLIFEIKVCTVVKPLYLKFYLIIVLPLFIYFSIILVSTLFIYI